MDRRRFLTATLAGVGTAVVAPHLLFAGSPAPQLAMPGGFSKANFQKLLNTEFTIIRGVFDHTPVNLVDVTDVPASSKAEQFITIFRGPDTEGLPEGLYQFKHPKMGRFQLALKPMNQQSDGRYYEAAFSLLA